MTYFFLSLSPGKTPDGKKDFQRGPDGLRIIYNETDAKAALQAQHDAGNKAARLVISDREPPKLPIVQPIVQGSLTYHLDGNGGLICDQYPNVTLKLADTRDGSYDLFIDGKQEVRSKDLLGIKAEAEQWRAQGLLDPNDE